MLQNIFLTLFLLTLASCSSSNDGDENSSFQNQKGEYIYRKSNETYLNTKEPSFVTPKCYPWQSSTKDNLPKITKNYFRCKGNILNPPVLTKQNETKEYIYDCCGTQQHGLPLRNGKEFIYPILIDLLNYIQDQTNKKVVITCGHRCPEHNTYVDNSVSNRYSKHAIGAEVTFYVEGFESEPQKVVDILKQFYKSKPEYLGKKDFETFLRYDKSDSNVSIQPWYNKEVFIKIFSKNEGRSIDNSHPYPYISIQVRYDKELNEKVNYSWEKATKNYHRK